MMLGNIPADEGEGRAQPALWLLGLLLVAVAIWLGIEVADARQGKPVIGGAFEAETEVSLHAGIPGHPGDGSAGRGSGGGSPEGDIKETWKPVTSVAELKGVSDRRALSGRAVQFDDVYVARVLSDSTLWIASPNDEEMQLFVVLRESGAAYVAADDQVDIAGTVVHLQPIEVVQWYLSGYDVRALTSDEVYIRASTLTTSRTEARAASR